MTESVSTTPDSGEQTVALAVGLAAASFAPGLIILIVVVTIVVCVIVRRKKRQPNRLSRQRGEWNKQTHTSKQSAKY